AGRFGGLAMTGSPVELVRDAAGTWADAPISVGVAQAFGMGYRAGRLEVGHGSGIEVFANGKHYGHRNITPTLNRTYLAVAGDGTVLVYDFAEILPQFVHKDGVFEGAFADRDTMLLWPGLEKGTYTWLNLATGNRVNINLEFPMAMVED